MFYIFFVLSAFFFALFVSELVMYNIENLTSLMLFMFFAILCRIEKACKHR